MALLREMLQTVFLISFTLLGFGFCEDDYKVPDVTIKVYEANEYVVLIPYNVNVSIVGFVGKVNTPIERKHFEEIREVTKKTKGGSYLYEHFDEVLKLDDTLYYTVFVLYNSLEYSKKGELKVKEFAKNNDLINCDISKTVINGQDDNCSGSLIFGETFYIFNRWIWTAEHYIPTRGPNFEFNSYENDEETVSIKDNKLIITPIPKQSLSEMRGQLDLRSQCTREKYPEECFYQHFGSFYLPAVRSGKIRSNFTFKYGRIDVKAKLPAGDWIFSEIALIPANQIDSVNASKLWIAYARGNMVLTNEKDEYIGGALYLSGEVPSPYEPQRSANVISYVDRNPLSKYTQIFSLVWSPESVSAFLNHIKIGEKAITSNFDECVISIGVGVGGNNDFPDGSKSGMFPKPWKNKDAKQLKAFFNARNDWLKSWKMPDSQLQLEEVKVYAL